jgi:hypothetical protein
MMYQLFSNISDPLCQFVVAICEEDDTDRRWPTVHGTGLLVQVRDDCFLISAAHVFDPLKEGRDLYFYSDTRTLCHLASAGPARLTPIHDGKRENDKFDVGVLKLEGPARPPYQPVDKFALPGDLLFPLQNPRDRQAYLVTGFPASKSKVKLKQNDFCSVPLAHAATSSPMEEYERIAVSPKSHIVLTFGKKVIRKNGQLQASPAPQGLSGSPVWLVNATDFAENRTHSTVVGIVTDHKPKSGALVATDIAVAWGLIKQFHSRLGQRPLSNSGVVISVAS